MSHSADSQPEEHNVHPVYRPDIDGLRAVAIMSVVAFHAFPRWFPGGFVGVDVFFVISGFLISTIIYRSLQRGDFSFSEFYAHRIKRIFPALIVVLTACYAFGWFVMLPDEFKQLGKHMAAGAGFVQNFILGKEVGYFDTAAELKPLLHLWSLSIEEQFYLIYPVLILFAWHARLNVLAVVLLLGLISFGLNISGVSANPAISFFMPQTRVWELLTGSVLAYFQFFKKAKLAAWMQRWIFHPVMFRHPIQTAWREEVLGSILSVAGLLLLVAAIWFIDKSKPFPGYWAVLPVSGAFLLILAGPEAWGNRLVLANRFMVFVGLISYPLYLWHWPILSFARIIEGEIPSREIRIGAVALSFVLAWITYRMIEKPIRFGKKTWGKITALSVALAVVGYVGYSVYQRGGLPFRPGIAQLKEVNTQFAAWPFIANQRCLEKYPLEGVKKYSWWFCMTKNDSPPTLLLLGNSYANHLYPGIISNDRFADHSVLSIGACHPGWIEGVDPRDKNELSPCFYDRRFKEQELINRILAKGSIQFVVIGSSLGWYMAEGAETLNRRIEYIQRHGAKVIVFYPPLFTLEHHPKNCTARPFKQTEKSCEIPRSKYNEALAKFHLIENKIKEAHPGVYFFNPNELFCDPRACSASIDGMPVYRDESGHYSEYASGVIARGFEVWARENLPELLY